MDLVLTIVAYLEDHSDFSTDVRTSLGNSSGSVVEDIHALASCEGMGVRAMMLCREEEIKEV